MALKKYFVSFTHQRLNSDGDPASAKQMASEIIQLDFPASFEARAEDQLNMEQIKKAISGKGYTLETIEVLHMNPL